MERGSSHVDEGGRYEEVDIETLEVSRPRTVGVENAVLSVMEEVFYYESYL